MDEAQVDEFFAKHAVPEAARGDYKMSLLEKAAKSTCIMKSHYVLDRIMDARAKMAAIMYYGQ